MSKIEFTFLMTSQSLSDMELMGKYNMSLHGETITHEGEEYTYIQNGLCREVYANEEKTRVLKVCHDRTFGDDQEDFQDWAEWGGEEGSTRGMPTKQKHNVLEAMAYLNAPEQYKKYLAECFLLPSGIVSQEFVKVFKLPGNIYGADLREAGVTNDGRVVVFDYDPLFPRLEHRKLDSSNFWYRRLPEMCAYLESVCPFDFVPHEPNSK